MPLARRRCPYCRTPLPIGEETRTLEVVYLDKALAGDFELVKQISSRGSTSVHSADNLILDQRVIVKTHHFDENVSEELLKRWKQIAKRSVRLDNPNVVKTFCTGEAGPIHYFISEYVPHKLLSDYLEEQGILPIWQSLRVARDIAKGAHAGHNLGITHHRIKPSNVTMPIDGFSRLLDFGTSRGVIDAISGKPWSPELESPLFLSPEQIETGFSDPLSDQYAIGVILFRMVTGTYPYPDTSENGAIARLNTPPPSANAFNSAVPKTLSLIIQQSLANDSQTRYESCDKLVDALESLDPELWTPQMDHPTSNVEVAVSRLLDQAQKAKRNREFRRSFFLCEQALVLAPYKKEVTDTLTELRKLLERESKVQRFINQGLSAFYNKRLDAAIASLTKAKQIDKDNPVIFRLTHEVLQEQERKRLTEVLLQTAQIDLNQNALTQAMAKIAKIQDVDPGNVRAAELKSQIESALEDSATIETLMSKAVDAVKSGDLDDALLKLQDVLSINPSHKQANLLTSRIQKKHKKKEIISLKSELEEQLNNGAQTEIIRILQRISVLDPNLADELHSKIDELKSVLATNATRIIKLPDPEEHLEADHEIIEDLVENFTGVDQPTRILTPDVLSTDTIDSTPPLPEDPIIVQKSPEHHETTESISPPPPQHIESGSNLEIPPFLDSSPDLELSPAMEEQKPPDDDSIDPQLILSSDIPENRSDADLKEDEIPLNFSLEPDKKSLTIPPWAIFTCTGIALILIISVFFLRSGCHNDMPIVPTPNPTSTPIPASPTMTAEKKTPKPSNLNQDKTLIELLNLAAKFESQKDYQQASLTYETILRLQPENIAAQSGQERCNSIVKKSRQETTRRKKTQSVPRATKTPKPRPPSPSSTPRPTFTSSPTPAIRSTASPTPAPSHTPTPKPTDTPEPPAAQQSDLFKITSVEFSPNPPRRGKTLKVIVRFTETGKNAIYGVWFHHRKPGETGYQQSFGNRRRKHFQFEIQAFNTKTDSLEYFVSAMDRNGLEKYFGSFDQPFQVKILQ